MKIDKYNKSDDFIEDYYFSQNNEGGLNLGEVKEVIWRRIPTVAGITLAVASFAFLKASTTTPVYMANFEILSEPVTVETKVTSTNSDSNENREEIVAVELDEVQLKILKSPKLILRAIDSLEDRYPDLHYKNLFDSLELKTNEKQNVLQVSYKNTSKQKVLDVLNTIAAVYLDYSIEKRQAEVNRGIEFLEEQIPRVQSRVQDLQQQRQELRQKYNFVEPQAQTNQTTDRLSDLINQQKDVQTKIQETELIAANLERELTEDPTRSITSINLGMSGYQNLVGQLQEIDSQIAQKSVIYSDQSVEIQTLKEQRSEIAALIAQEGLNNRLKLENQLQLLKNQEQNIQSQINDLKQQIELWSIVTNEYNDIQRQLALATDQLNAFTIQRDSLAVDAAQREAPWELLTPVDEPQINAASTINYLVLGSALGLLLGIGAALIIDKCSNIIYTSAKVQQVTDLPIVGFIPFDSTNKKWFSPKNINYFKNNNSSDKLVLDTTNEPLLSISNSAKEEFRFCCANLGLFDLDNSIKSLIITSAMPGEGKSTFALNLAKAAAAMGKRVLLVDTDMRNSKRLTTYLQLSETEGLRDYLTQQNTISPIKTLPLQKNFSILSSGNVEDTAIDPSRLLASNRMRDLIKHLEDSFELIIYDMSAIAGFADVSLLAAHTDGIVMVTGLGKLQNIAFIEALNQLKLVKTKVLGIVINKMTSN